MARRVAEAALKTPEQAPTTHRVRTTAQLDFEARALCERRKLSHQAARWAFENEKGSRAACSSGLFGDPDVVTRNIVEPLLRQLKATGKIEDHRDHKHQILTNVERQKLAAWILACADGQDPKDRTNISTKIRAMLKARHASNKSKKYGRGSVLLNPAEVSAAESVQPRLAKMFFERFYPWCRAHDIAIEEGVERSQDQNRAVKMTEKTVQRHFHGEFGLEAELIDAGIMDPVTKVIADPRRVINCDETPQPVDAPQKGSRKKKEAEAAAASERDAAFALCELGCVCELAPCPYAKWKRCPTCGPKSGLCKVRVCVAARKPLLLGYMPPVGLLEGPRVVGLLEGPTEGGAVGGA